VDEKRSFATLIRDGKAVPLVLGEDAYFSSSVDLPSAEVTAPLVFIGYGLKIPEKADDDYAGLDLKGEVVVYVSGSLLVADGVERKQWASVGIRRWKRETNLAQKTIYAILSGAGVRPQTMEIFRAAAESLEL
jgi:hypothetical protein